jgi:hypothetical protein
LRGFAQERAHAAIRARCLIGLERDQEFAAAARRRLPHTTVHCCEALLEPPAALAHGADVVIGNPPYLRSIRLERADARLHNALRGRYAATSYGEWDLYAAFLEQALEWTRPGGEVGLVVPSRWLTAAYAARLREKLGRLGAVRALIDFGAEQIFPGATTYASVAFLTRRPSRRVQVARYSGERWRCGEIASDTLGAAPWRLAVGKSRRLLDRLAAAGPPLGEVARIVKGTGTNADPVFVFSEGDGKPEIEAELLRLCLRGRDVAAFGAASPAVRCLLPYRDSGELIPPAELACRYPRAAAYLDAQRARLEAREAGRFAGPTFYCFGRPQNIAFLTDRRPKVVVPDVARAGRALLDRRAAMVLDSAYAIRAGGGTADIDEVLILAVMNSRAVRLWLRETGVPLRGGYLRLKTAYLRSLPLPTASHECAEVRAALRSGRARRDPELLDDLVRRAYRISASDWQAEM